MANPLLDLTPPSMENFSDVEQEQPENAGQAMVDPIPLNETFNPPSSSTPEEKKKVTRSSAERRCKKLQKEKYKIQKQVLHLRKELAKMRRPKETFRKSGKRLMARERVGLSGEKAKRAQQIS